MRESRRLRGVEGVRALAALGVLTWHVWSHPTLAPSYGVDLGALTKIFNTMRVGVAMFFVLSGLLLFRPFAAALLRGEALPSMRRYVTSRALRILPAYWAILLLVALAWQQRLLHHPLELVSNLTLTQTYVPAYQYRDINAAIGIIPAWSLCVEAVFYLTLPFLAWGSFRLARSGKVKPMTAAIFPIVVLAVLGVASDVLADTVIPGVIWQNSFATHAHWFAVGMALAVLSLSWEEGRLRLPRAWRPAALALALVLTLAAIKGYYGGALSFLDEQSLLAVACGALLMVVVMPSPRSLLVRVLEWRPLVAVGLASYSIFLWHEPVLRELRAEGVTRGGAAGFVLDLLLVAGIAAALSTMTYLLIERPALALAHRRPRRDRRPPLPSHAG